MAIKSVFNSVTGTVSVYLLTLATQSYQIGIRVFYK
jgi:hypothetical protein